MSRSESSDNGDEKGVSPESAGRLISAGTGMVERRIRWDIDKEFVLTCEGWVAQLERR